MKLGVAYNVFDGTELLGQSIKAIRSQADYVVVVYQKISNVGNLSFNVEKKVKDLLDKKIIDRALCFSPDLNKTAQWNELYKRHIGLQECIIANCTHHITMDCDEFFDNDQFQALKKKMIEGDFDSSACQMQTYYKHPTFAIDPPESYFVPLIYKINKESLFNFQINFPVPVDPTRIMQPKKCLILSRKEIEMHHMSYVRRDITSKLLNSSARVNFEKDIDQVIKVWSNYKFPERALLAGKPSRWFDVKKVENKFGINV